MGSLAIGGCSSTPHPERIVYIQPECSVPVLNTLPEIDAGELWDKVGNDMYWKLMDRERVIVDWSMEMKAVLEVICKKTI